MHFDFIFLIRKGKIREGKEIPSDSMSSFCAKYVKYLLNCEWLSCENRFRQAWNGRLTSMHNRLDLRRLTTSHEWNIFAIRRHKNDLNMNSVKFPGNHITSETNSISAVRDVYLWASLLFQRVIDENEKSSSRRPQDESTRMHVVEFFQRCCLFLIFIYIHFSPVYVQSRRERRKKNDVRRHEQTNCKNWQKSLMDFLRWRFILRFSNFLV